MRSFFFLAFFFFFFALTEAGVICTVNSTPNPLVKNMIRTWTCDKNPYATKQTVHFENPRGFNMALVSTDGANRCTGAPLNGNTEGTYTWLSLTNLTFFNVPCTQIPCCIRISCGTNNAEDCTGWKLSSVFSNDLASDTDATDVANYTSDKIDI